MVEKCSATIFYFTWYFHPWNKSLFLYCKETYIHIIVLEGAFSPPLPQKCHKRGKTVGWRGLHWEQKWVRELAGQLVNPLVSWSTKLVNPLAKPFAIHAPLPDNHRPSSKNIKEKRQWAAGGGIHWVQWESGGDSNRGAIALVTDHWSDKSAFFIQFDFFFFNLKVFLQDLSPKVCMYLLLKDMRNPLIECLPGDSFSSLSRQGLLELLWTVLLKIKKISKPF